MSTKATDREYTERTVRKATRGEHERGWNVEQDDGWSLFVPHKAGLDVKAGSTIRVYGRGIGFPFRGIDVDGVEVFYRSAAEDERFRLAEVEKQHAKERADFYAKIAAHNANYAALPVEFRKRVDGFRATSKDWRWRFEAYEVFTLGEAAKIARRLKTAKAVREFAKLKTWVAQKRRVRTISRDHSGNTFGAAVHFALVWLERPKLLAMDHGALCPLVGCDKYGCYTTRKEQANA
mgnify:FL=1